MYILSRRPTIHKLSTFQDAHAEAHLQMQPSPYVQELDGGITETVSEAPGAYGGCGGSHAAWAAPYQGSRFFIIRHIHNHTGYNQ